MELFVFLVAGGACIAGALGVVLNSNPVHAALSLVGTLFGIAVLFVAQEAHFLAAVQVIVYAGAIVVLFLFVIMLLGVDTVESWEQGPLSAQRYIAGAIGIIGAAMVAILATRAIDLTERVASDTSAGESNIVAVGRTLFTDYVFAFELTGVLLVVAVVGAVVMARRPKGADVEQLD